MIWFPNFSFECDGNGLHNNEDSVVYQHSVSTVYIFIFIFYIYIFF